MDGSNRPAALGQVQVPGQVIGGEPVPAGGDWRTQLQQDSRERIVNKIMETLKRNLPCSGPEGLQELKEIAVKFEGKIYTVATSQSDYARKISLKMLTMETKSQNPMANSLQSNAASNSRNPQDPELILPHLEVGDWGTQLQQDSRQRVAMRMRPEMDGNNWRAAQGQVQMPGQVISSEPVPAGRMEGGDWRTQLQQDSRERIVDKILETLKRHISLSGQEGLQELKNIAVKFEEKIYTAATSQSDYLRRISLKMLTMETKSQNPTAKSSSV